MRIELKQYGNIENGTIRIYRHYIPFAVHSLPAPLVELPINTDFYYDDTVELNRLVYYRVSIVKNGVETVGSMYTTIKRYYTGPQINPTFPDMVIRGDSNVGKYGTLPLKDVITIDQALAHLPSCTLLPNIDLDTVNVEKCIYNGNVLFLFSTPVFEGSLESLYNDGSLFSYGDGKDFLTDETYSKITNKVNQGKITNVNDHSFKLRLITEDEFLNLYSKLYPNSTLGKLSGRIISNQIEHGYISPVINPYAKNEVFKAMGLDGTTEEVQWTTKRPLHIVIELLNRGDMNWPEPTLVITNGDAGDNMFYSHAEIVNDRLHVFGGINQITPSGSVVTTKHISYDLNGADKKEHAPLPVGVVSAATWSYGGKIYCYGGVKALGDILDSYTELYDHIQVWEDNGTEDGLWTTINSNVPYNFGSSASIYYDELEDKDMVMILGGYETLQPGSSQNMYVSELTNFNGTFIKLIVDNSGYTGGGILGQHHNEFIWVSPSNEPGKSNRSMFIFETPNTSTPATVVVPDRLLLQGTELDVAKYGKMNVYRDTVFMCTDTSVGVEDNQLFIYQYVPSEKRWLKIITPVPELPVNKKYTVSCAFNHDKLAIYLNTSDSKPKVFTLTLIDPLTAPIKPVVVTVPENNYISPPYGVVRV